MAVRARLILGWVLLVGSVICWPLSSFTFARHEPQFVLGLSWLAIILTALDLIETTAMRKSQDDDGG